MNSIFPPLPTAIRQNWEWMSSRTLACFGMACVLAMHLGCASTINYRLPDRSCVATELATRTGNQLGASTCPGKVVFPNGIALDDGLTEEEAVLLSLWNNAAFQELMADLGIAHGDLVQAGLLPNPEMVYFLPVSDKPFKYLFDMPLESLWLRPLRVAAAEREYCRVNQRLVQNGLDLIRDVRQAYADVLLARARQGVAHEALVLRGRVMQNAESRLKAGDISPQEASTAQIDSLQASQDYVRLQYDVDLTLERLRNLMGLSDQRIPLQLVEAEPQYPPPADVEMLSHEATRSRPDAQSAAQSVAGATERLRLSKISWIRFLGILDATSGRNTGHEFGPAARFTLPIFNRNQGGIERAEGELEKAQRQLQTIHNQIVLEVHQSHLRYTQAQAELELLVNKVRPEVEAAIRRTDKAYLEGETPYVVVLQTTRQMLDSRFREAQLRADLRRAWADLERSVGRHLDDLALPAIAPTPVSNHNQLPETTNQ